MVKKELHFEQGPIRPPNEAQSLLLRFTRNCPWNQCLFCPVYKNTKFSLRTVEEIKEDIQTARDMADDIKALSCKLGHTGQINEQVIRHILGRSDYADSYRSVAAWLYYGTGACFLQDADNLVMKTKDLVDALKFLKKKFPDVKRITTYSRSRTIVRKSVDSLIKLRDAGLDRIHVGLESGYDPVLKFIKKGVTGAQHIEAGRKVMEAGIELSEYVIPGLGGQAMWHEHALETARVLNQINPHFIRLRSLRVPDRVPLHQKLKDGSFVMQTDDMVAEEIKLFIDTLDGITSMVASDHIMNLLEEVSGKLPEGKEAMLGVVTKYLELPDSERLIFRVGRRGGAYRSTNDLGHDPVTYKKIEDLIQDITAREGLKGVEIFIAKMVDQYV
ncbi:MAG: radical SAM protein [Thermodesulfobacteriota bacterium]|nr:radical SAM protein [Thermodesulfobacteriota bacterium]